MTSTNTAKKVGMATAIRTKNSNGSKRYGVTNRIADRGEGGERRKAKANLYK